MQAQPGTQPRHLRNHRSQSLRLKYAQKKIGLSDKSGSWRRKNVWNMWKIAMIKNILMQNVENMRTWFGLTLSKTQDG